MAIGGDDVLRSLSAREIAVGHGSSAFLEFQKEGKREKLRNFRFERESRRIKILYVSKYMYNIIIFYSC